MLRALDSPQRYRFVVLAASTYLILAANGGVLLLVVALKEMATEFGWPRSVPSTAYSLQFIGTGVGGILMGWWFDRSGVAPVVLLGSVMLGAGAVLTGLVTAQWQLYAIYGLMMGLLGQATMFGPLMVNVMRWFEHRRGFAVGVVAAGQSLAGAMWPPLFRHFNETVGWRETFIGFGVFALLSAVPLTAALRRRPPGEERWVAELPAPAKGSGSAPTELGIPVWAVQATLCIAIVGCCVAMSMPLAHIVAHTSDLGHDTARAAEMLSIALGTTLVVRLAAGSLVLDRFGGLVALFAFSATQAAALTLYAFVDGLPGLYLTSILFGLGYGGIGLCYPIIVREYLPAREAGRRLGIVNLFGASAMGLGGWLAGFVFDFQGTYSPAFLAGVGFNLANLAIIAALLTRRRTMKLRPALA